MLPGFKALKLYKGDTFAFRLNASSKVSENPLVTEPYDITGATFISQIKEKGKSAVVAEFSCSIEDGPAGQLLVTLTATESSKLNSSKKYEYDVQMNNDGVVSTVLNGPIIVVREISS